jgi:HAD superfamily hydrolase (TIGR01509 family)
MKQIKAIFFDAGGVLFRNTYEPLRKNFLKTFHFSPFLFSDYPKKISKKYDKKVVIGTFSYKQALFEIGKVKEIDKPKIYSSYKKWYIQSQATMKQVYSLAKKLSKHYDTYCLTNITDLPLQVNKEIGFFYFFKKVYASCEMRVRKPQKRAFTIPLRELKLKPGEVLFIDNTPANISSAKSLGINSILFKDYSQLIREIKKFNLLK